MAKRLMLDTNIYDLIVARRGFTTRLNDAVAAGHIEILRTPVQEEEIAQIPDAAKRAAMRKVRGRRISTSDAAWALSDRPPSADLQIAVTADAAADVLVTEDRDLSERMAATTSRLELWRFDQLVRFIEALL